MVIVVGAKMLPEQPTADRLTPPANGCTLTDWNPYTLCRFSLFKLFVIMTAVAAIAAVARMFATGEYVGPLASFWVYLHLWCIATAVRHFCVTCSE